MVKNKNISKDAKENNKINLNLIHNLNDLKSVIQQGEIVTQVPAVDPSLDLEFQSTSCDTRMNGTSTAETNNSVRVIDQQGYTHDELVKIVSAAIAEPKEKQSESTDMSLTGALKASLKTPYGVPTTNRYEALSDNGMETDDDAESTTSSRRRKRPPRPPPIVLHGVMKNTKTIIEKIQNATNTRRFYLKFSVNRTNIFFEDMTHYKLFLCKIGDEIEYHTFTPKGEKQHAYVVYNLNTDYTEAEIKEELIRQYKLEVEKVLKLKKTKTPIYMVTMNQKTSIQELNSECSLLHYTKIRWAKYNSKKAIIQCKRCQEWGHATSNCRAKPRCVKCPGNHLTSECQLQERDQVKCCNCGGKHPASSEECPVYQDKIEAINKNKKSIAMPQRREERYKPAPPPAINPWTRQTDEKSFPPLAGKQPATVPQQNVTKTDKSTDNMNDFNSLIDELNTLNQLTDVRFMLNAVRELNQKLKTTTNKMQQFQIFFEFSQQLNG